MFLKPVALLICLKKEENNPSISINYFVPKCPVIYIF